MDRTRLVDATVHTVIGNMLEGVLLVSFIVFLFLFNWRTTVIVASVIPLSFLFAITMLRIQGLPANLISMGALDFGLLLEGTLVITEVVFVALLQKSQERGSISAVMPKAAYKEECRFGCFSYFLCSDYSGGGAVPYFLVSESGRKDVFSAGFYAWVCSSRLFAIVAYLCPCYVQGVVFKTDKREEQQGYKGIGGMAHFVLLLH
mgnify:CR=1 FL=1